MALLDRWPAERRETRDPVTGTRIIQLTSFPAHHFHLSAPTSPFTPSGDHLLFVSNRSGHHSLQLFRLELPSGTIDQITETDRLDPDSVTPAANGRQAIAALRGEEGEVIAIDLETGDVETLAVFLEAEVEGCHLSASGEYVATIVRRAEEATITAVHTEGMRSVPIHEARRPLAAARFSPDSKNTLLYLAAPDSLCCVEFDGTGDRVVYSGVQAFRRSGVQESEPANAKHPDARTPERLNACPPTWLGSGEEILLIPGPGPGPILAVPRLGGSVRPVAALPSVWARSDHSGRRIVAVAARQEEQGGGVGSGEAAGEIVLIDAQTGTAQPLCSRCSLDARPCFSPDGRAVVYSSRDADDYSQLFLIETDPSSGSSD